MWSYHGFPCVSTAFWHRGISSLTQLATWLDQCLLLPCNHLSYGVRWHCHFRGSGSRHYAQSPLFSSLCSQQAEKWLETRSRSTVSRCPVLPTALVRHATAVTLSGVVSTLKSQPGNSMMFLGALQCPSLLSCCPGPNDLWSSLSGFQGDSGPGLPDNIQGRPLGHPEFSLLSWHDVPDTWLVPWENRHMVNRFSPSLSGACKERRLRTLEHWPLGSHENRDSTSEEWLLEASLWPVLPLQPASWLS